MSWSVEEYTLAEVKTQVDLPCVVKVTEGFFGEGESDSFSRDDIIKLDEFVNLQKVVATFVYDVHNEEMDYADEIQIPLNYKGKLHVIRAPKVFQTVEQLARNPPRYAKLLDAVRIPFGYKGQGQVLPVGSVIEIDRVLPPMPAVNNAPPKEESSLVVIVGENALQLPFSIRKRFQVEPDRNEYTLREVIERFNLPQIVQFVDTTVQEVFVRNLRDGVENMSSITGTLRLKRLVLQDVFIGHYKGIEYSEDDASSQFVRRCVVAIPLNEFSETVVQVLQEDDPQDYEIFVANNFSQTAGTHLVDGTLYAEFTKKPMLFKFPNETPPPSTDAPPVPASSESTPPPRPPRPDNYQYVRTPARPVKTAHTKQYSKGQTTQQQPDKLEDLGDYEPVSPGGSGDSNTAKLHNQGNPDSIDDLDDYEEMKAGEYVNIDKKKAAAQLGAHAPGSLGFSIADCFGTDVPLGKAKASKSSAFKKVRKMVKRTFSKPRTFSPTQDCIFPVPEETYPLPSEDNDPMGFTLSDEQEDEEEENHAYDEPDDVMALHRMVPEEASPEIVPVSTMHEKSPKPAKHEKPPVAAKPKKSETQTKNNQPETPSRFRFPERNIESRPMATVTPVSTTKPQDHRLKCLADLTVSELNDRLQLCGLGQLAKVCLSNTVDGNFLVNLDDSDLIKDPFNLKSFQLRKLDLMKKNNWVPNTE